MEPPQPSTPQQTNGKLRLMCSYGGHIVPSPQKISLIYAGGDTRIISVPAASTATISAFSAHIASALHLTCPFTLKYQLPLHQLDSLISLSSDDDLQIFLEEHQRLSSSSAPSRIRLFVFPVKQRQQRQLASLLTTQPELTTTQCGLTHPKTESWFVDALKSAKMMQKGEVGFPGDGQSDGQSGGALYGQESLMLETTSSFGSSSSSVSLSNLPPIKACGGDDNIGPSQENKTKLPSADSTASDTSSVASAIYHAQTGTSQDPTVNVAVKKNKVALNAFESSDTKMFDPVSEVQEHKTVKVSGYPASEQLQQQQMQFGQMGTNLASQNPTDLLPVPSYYPVYNMLPHQQHLQYLPNQSCPVYVVPVAQTQIYDPSTQYGSNNALPVVSGRPPLHPNSTLVSSQVAYKEVTPVPPIPEFLSQVYGTAPMTNSFVHIPFCESKQQNVVSPQMHIQSQLVGVAPRETANYSNEHDNDPALAQIYKSQPPPPLLPSQYQTMTKASTVLLSEALAHLQVDNIMQQQVRPSQPALAHLQVDSIMQQQVRPSQPQ